MKQNSAVPLLFVHPSSQLTLPSICPDDSCLPSYLADCEDFPISLNAVAHNEFAILRIPQ
jgi:hypothetical protein